MKRLPSVHRTYPALDSFVWKVVSLVREFRVVVTSTPLDANVILYEQRLIRD